MLLPLQRALLRPIVTALAYVEIRPAPRSTVLGFSVFCTDVGANCGDLTTKTREALDLICRFDPRRFNRMKRDVRGIAVTTRGASYYDTSLRLIYLDRAVIGEKPDYIASTIVHEAVHARLYRSGVRSYVRIPQRHEELCTAEEIEFASKLPQSEALVEGLKGALAKPWWTEESRRKRIALFAERHNLPDWLKNLLVRWTT